MFGVIDQGTPARPLYAPADCGAAVLDVMGVRWTGSLWLISHPYQGVSQACLEHMLHIACPAKTLMVPVASIVAAILEECEVIPRCSVLIPWAAASLVAAGKASANDDEGRWEGPVAVHAGA